MVRSKQWARKALFSTDFWKAGWKEKAVAEAWKKKHGFISFCVFLLLGETFAVIVIEICLLFCGFELIKEYNGIILCSCHLGSEKNNSHCFTSDWLFPGTEVLLNHTEIVCPVWCSIAVSGRIRLSDICSDSSHTDEKLAQVAFCTTDRQLKALGFELVCWVFSNGAFWECFHYFWTAHC